MWIFEMKLNRVDFRIQWLAVVFLAPPAAVVAAADATSAIPQNEIECYQIDNAKIIIDADSAKKNFGMANFGHQIGVGKNTVIAIRRYDDPGTGPDSQSFFKTTIELKKLPVITDKMQTDVAVIYSFHSEGSSGFVPKSAYDWSNAPLRKISIKTDADTVSINYSQDVLGKDAASGKPKPLSIKASCRLRKIMIQDLNLWQGHPGTGLESFYPPSKVRG